MKKIIVEISTHKAVKTENGIDIIIKGLTIDGDVLWKDEKIYTISLENEDDVASIMDNYEEDNRINRAEFLTNGL